MENELDNLLAMIRSFTFPIELDVVDQYYVPLAGLHELIVIDQDGDIYGYGSYV